MPLDPFGSPYFSTFFAPGKKFLSTRAPGPRPQLGHDPGPRGPHNSRKTALFELKKVLTRRTCFQSAFQCNQHQLIRTTRSKVVNRPKHPVLGHFGSWTGPQAGPWGSWRPLGGHMGRPAPFGVSDASRPRQWCHWAHLCHPIFRHFWPQEKNFCPPGPLGRGPSWAMIRAFGGPITRVKRLYLS